MRGSKMEEIKKELAELKELVSKMLELQKYEHDIKYGYLKKQLNATNRQH